MEHIRTQKWLKSKKLPVSVLTWEGFNNLNVVTPILTRKTWINWTLVSFHGFLWIFKRAEITAKTPRFAETHPESHSPEWRVIKSPLCPRQGAGKADSCGISPSCLYNIGPTSEDKIGSEVNSTWRWILLPFQPPLQVLSYPRNPELWHWRSQPGDTGTPEEESLIKGHRTLHPHCGTTPTGLWYNNCCLVAKLWL